MQLQQVAPALVARDWERIKPALAEALPPITRHSEERMNWILAAILKGDAQAWILEDEEEGKRLARLIVVTTFTYDAISRARNLEIYALYAYRPMSDKAWRDACLQMMKFARAHGADRIVAFTEVERIIDVVKKLGGEARYTFVTIDVPQGGQG